MPAFGSKGIYNLNKAEEAKELWQLVKPDGTVVMSCNCKEQLEGHQKILSQKLNCELTLVKKNLQLL